MPLGTKTQGYGFIISAFQSREFGFGIKLSKIELDKVNCSRNNKIYIDTEVAINILNNCDNNAFFKSLFYQLFDFWANVKGNRCYGNNQKTQWFTENVYILNFDYFFYLIIVVEMTKKRKEGLDVSNMLLNMVMKE